MKWQVPTQVSLLVETLNLSMSLRNIGHFLLCQKKVALNSSNDITGMLAVLLTDLLYKSRFDRFSVIFFRFT